jgi:hypothetical protein
MSNTWKFSQLRVAAVALTLIALAAARPALAKIDLVTLPSRDETQITIYNSEDITLVDEKRLITFKKGLNEIQFSWAGTLIDPTSLELQFMEHKGEFDILDVTYPANTQNVLVWAVESRFEGVAPIKISYFLSGVTWSADYVLIADAPEKLAGIEGYVRVTNNSGEDFENTKVRLVVGSINLVDQIAELARRRQLQPAVARKMAASEMRLGVAQYEMAMDAAAPPEVKKEAISDYFIYTVSGTSDIPNGWSKRIKSMSADKVPIEVVYKHDPRKTGPIVQKLYRYFNKEESNLGDEPLPDGLWNVFIEREGAEIFPAGYSALAGGADGAMGLSFLQAVAYKYVPKGEKVDLNLGSDGLLVVEDKMMRLGRDRIDFNSSGNVIGYDETEEWTIEVRNSKDTAVPVEIVRYFSGDFDFTSQNDYEKESEDSRKFTVTVPGQDKRELNYTVLTRKGSNAKK